MIPPLESVLSAIDELNSADPNSEEVDGKDVPKELIYSERMSQRLSEFEPNASEELQIAARAQHVQRWKIKRSEYPDGKAGYYRWRSELGKMHAEIAVGLMAEAGYNEKSREKARRITSKQGIKQDKEVQTLEDVACLVFLEHYFLPFAEKHSEEKVISILQKTWRKMSESGQAAALKLPLEQEAIDLIEKALK